jgi:hypothetical protein
VGTVASAFRVRQRCAPTPTTVNTTINATSAMPVCVFTTNEKRPSLPEAPSSRPKGATSLMSTYCRNDPSASQLKHHCAVCDQRIERDQDGVRTVYWRKKKPHCSAKCVTGQPRQPLLTNAELWGDHA